MRRSIILLAALLVGAAAGTQPLRGQAIPGTPSGSRFSYDFQRQLADRLGVEPATPNEAPHWHHRILSALGSAALGAGVGYFASQLVRGDWSEGPGRGEPVNRSMWAAVGGGVGATLGFSFPIFGRGSPDAAESIQDNRRSVLTRAEMSEHVLSNAYQAIELLRPEWLRQRPPDVWGQLSAATAVVYLDDQRLGPLSTLRDISVNDIESIRLVTVAEATTRWGTGHNQGVIQIITRDH